ncbi:hypothetical protein K461DRAFT_321835 [Myriangium duriaei CBS 260.36]|uniref:Uncharacterized protein n=1 Tax=Myriangium duriaei CBS 260.36 TaxID=1168546 RepID=A0A9P4MEV0_9PEZI|nr:hypothetical protein K461DRAFT_321835 [Myriangium duriaei CBS 260.36]
MHASSTLAASLLFSLALAADHVPVTIKNFDPGFDVNCGSTTVVGRDIYNAVAWGMSLNENGETLKAGNGEDKDKDYPSYYGNSEKFKWVSSECNNNPKAATQHMPVIKGGFFGEDGNTDAGKFRAVYWYNYETDNEGHPLGYYCGTIWHSKNDGSFAGCDVLT